MSYILRVKIIGVSNEAGDVAVNMQCHLTDTTGIPFTTSGTNSFGTLDEFVVRAPKSSIPGTGRLAYLTALAADAIALKYDANLDATGEDGSDVLVMETTSVDRIFLDLLVDGPGVTTPTPLISVLSTTNVLLTDPLILEFTGDAVSNEIAVTGDLTLDDNTITSMSSTTGLADGMFISGPGIPSFATIVSITAADEIIISQNALLTSVTAALVFTDNPDSEFLTSVTPAILSDRYVGMSIVGAGLPDNTTIAEVISSSEARLSTLATSTETTETYAITGTASYFFDTSGLTVDYTDLQRVLDIVDFDLL